MRWPQRCPGAACPLPGEPAPDLAQVTLSGEWPPWSWTHPMVALGDVLRRGGMWAGFAGDLFLGLCPADRQSHVPESLSWKVTRTGSHPGQGSVKQAATWAENSLRARISEAMQWTKETCTQGTPSCSWVGDRQPADSVFPEGRTGLTQFQSERKQGQTHEITLVPTDSSWLPAFSRLSELHVPLQEPLR